MTFPDAATSRHLFDLSIDLEPAQTFGKTPFGGRTVFIVKGGRFEGPAMRGVVLAGGGDWLLTSKSHNELDVRITLQGDDGALIYMTYRGVLAGDPQAIGAASRGEDVPDNAFYFRTTPRFETASEQYGWLNATVCIAYGRPGPSSVSYRVFVIT